MKQIIILFLGLLALVACKKTETPAPTTPPSSGGTTTTYGDLQTLYIQKYNNNVFIGYDSTVIASFYDYPGGSSSPVYLNAGNVNYNGVSLKSYSTYYRDTTHLVNIHTQNSVWNVSGSNSVSAFSCTYTPTYPVFTGNALLPDSFSISSGVTINVSGISNMSQSSISVIISLGGVNVSKSIPINQTSCTFTPNELTSLSPTASGAVILLTFSNLSTKTLGGKLYGLDNSLEHIKYGVKIKY